MEEEEIKSRFSDQVELLGVAKSTIAKKIGFSAQTFTNITSGRNMPSVLLLHKIQRYFPSFDLSYVISGVKKSDDSDSVKKLREELDFQKAIVGKLVGKSKSTKSPLAREKDNRVYAAKKANAQMRGFKRPSKSLVFRTPNTPLIFRFSDN